MDWWRKLPGKEKYICRIDDVKPVHCRRYPQSRKHAEETGCRGFEEWVRVSGQIRGLKG